MECTIFLTTECNFKCSYCYEPYNKCQVMSVEMLTKIIDYIFTRGNDTYFYINFFGGEPTLRKDLIYYAVEYIQEKYYNKGRITYSINTNMSLLDDTMIAFLKENKFMVKMSIDGDKHTNNINRVNKNGQDTYDLIIENAKKVRDSGINNIVRMTVTNNNLMYMYDNVRYFHELGFEKINIGIDFNTQYSEDDLQILKNNFMMIADYYIQMIDQHRNISIDYFNGQFTKFVFDFENKFIMCGGGITSLKFMPNGDIYPCNIVCGDNRFLVGNIITAPTTAGNVMRMVSENMKNNTRCDECEIAFYCQYMKCGYINYINTGYYNLPDEVHCKIQKITYPIVKRIFDYLILNRPQVIKPLVDYAKLNKIKIKEGVENVYTNA